MTNGRRPHREAKIESETSVSEWPGHPPRKFPPKFPSPQHDVLPITPQDLPTYPTRTPSYAPHNTGSTV